MTEIPDIKSKPREWFNFFDADKTGTLDKAEIKQALVYTLNTYNIESIDAMIDGLW